jgi:hypothetical protein
MKEKVVVLRELQRAIIYTNELSKQAMEGHVNTAFRVYSVNEGARLTLYYNGWDEKVYRKVDGFEIAYTLEIDGIPNVLQASDVIG